MNKYLAGNPIDILLDDSDAIIRYLTLRDITGESGAILQKSYETMAEDIRAQVLVSKIKDNILGDVNTLFDFKNGAAFLIAKALSFGFDERETFIAHTIGAILKKWQHPNGGIHGPWQPPYPDAALTGEIISLALQSHIFDRRVQNGIDWILAHQRPDGGWLHAPISGIVNALTFLFFSKSRDPMRHDSNSSIPSCTIATALCVKALLASQRMMSSSTIAEAIERGARYLLANNLKVMKTITTPCNYQLQNISTCMGFPVFLTYDELLGLLIISRAGLFNASEANMVFNAIVSKQTDSGLLPYENISRGMIIQTKKDLQTTKSPGKWPTLNFFRALRFADLL